MKRNLLVFLVISLISTFTIGISVQDSMAAEKKGKAKYGGIIRPNHSKQAGIIGDPLLIQAWNHEFVDFVLQTIARSSNDRFGEFDPVLCEKWTIAPDKSNIVFNLRKGMKFHDGTDCNAQAVKFNYDRYLKSSKPQLSTMKSVEALDDHTVRVNFNFWDVTTFRDFTRGTFIISPTAFEKNGAEWAKFNPVGTGAFKVVKQKRNTYIKYEKFIDYWEKGLPYLDGVLFTMIPDPMTAAASIRRGEIDAMLGVDPVTGSDFKKSGGFDLILNPAIHNIIYFNSEDPNSIWSNLKLREALEYAINKQQIADVIMRGFSSPVYEILHSITPAAGKKLGTTPRLYNPEKARQLIKEAGFPGGVKAKVFFNATAPALRNMFLAIQANLKDVGIDIVPAPLSGAALHSKVLEPMTPNDLIIEHIRGGGTFQVGGVKTTFHPDSIWLRGAKRPKRFVELIDKVMKTFDIQEQLKICIEMERIAYNDAMYTPIVGNNFIVIQAPYVKDAYWFWAGGPQPELKYAWLNK